MSKFIGFIIAAVEIGIGIATGNPALIISGIMTAVSQAVADLTAPGTPARQAAELDIQLGEQPRCALFGETYTAGTLVDAFNYGGQYGTDWEVQVVRLADHRCQGLTGFFVNDQFVAYTGDGAVAGYSGQLQVFFRSDTTNQALPAILTANGPGWTATDKGDSGCDVVVAYKADSPNQSNPVWPGGRPRFGWVVKGKLCYDPRLDSTVPGGSGAHRWTNPATWTWSENAAVCRYNWVRGIYANDAVTDPSSLLVGRGLSDAEAPPENIFAAANLCDETVGTPAAPRYRVAGPIYANQVFIDVEDMFAWATGGVTRTVQGSVELEPGQAKSVVASFTDDDLLSASKVSWNDEILSESATDWVNGVVASYVEPAQQWQPKDAPIVRDTADIAADGEPREATITMRLCKWVAQAQRVAEIARRMGRQWGRASVSVGPKLCQLEDGDWVNWTSQRHFGGATKTFRIDAYSVDEKWQSTWALHQINSEAFDEGAFNPDQADAVGTTGPVLVAPAAGDFALSATFVSGSGEVLPALQLAGAATWSNVEAIWIEYRVYAVGLGVDANWVSVGVESPLLSTKTWPVAGSTQYQASLRYRVSGTWSPRQILGPVLTAAYGVGWGGNITGVPIYLTDGRVGYGLTAPGDLGRPVPNSIRVSSGIMGHAAGGTYVGDLAATANNPRGGWSATTAYAVNDMVIYSGTLYICISAVRAATAPPNDAAHWSKYTAANVQDGATVGAAWGTNLTGTPTELTDGRVAGGLASTGDLARPVPNSIRVSSGIMGHAAGGTYTGDLDAQGNYRIAVDGNGLLQGIGTGAGTAVSNAHVTIRNGSLYRWDTDAGLPNVIDNVYAAIGTNLVVNSEFTLTDPNYVAGAQIPVGFWPAWTGNNVPPPTVVDARVTLADGSYGFGRTATGAMTNGNAIDGLAGYAGTDATLAPRYWVPVQPGDTLALSALVAHQGCANGYVEVQFADETFTYSGEISGVPSAHDIGAAAFTTISRKDMALNTLVATVPADGVAWLSGTQRVRWARINVRFLSNGAANPRLLVAAPLLAKIPTGQTAVPPYHPGPADRAATYGAAWGNNLTGRPTELTDGRVAGGLASTGDLARPVPNSIRVSSGIMGHAAGGTYTGDLAATANNPRGGWSATTAYARNDMVIYSGTLYICISAVQTATAPPNDAAHWSKYTAANVQDGATVGAQSGVNLKNSAGTSLGDGDVVNQFGVNVIQNSDFSQLGNNAYGWCGAWVGNVTGGTTTYGVNINSSYSGQLNVAYAHVANVANPGSVGQAFDSHFHLPAVYQPSPLSMLQQYALAVNDGDRVFASALLAAHRCYGALFIQFFNGAGYASGFGGYVGGDAQGPNGGRQGGAGNGDPANFDRLTLFATAPAGARFAVLRIRGNTNQAPTDNDSWLFYTQMMLCKVPAGMTTAPAYNPGVLNYAPPLQVGGSGAMLGDGFTIPPIVAAGNRYIYSQLPTYSAPATTSGNVGSSTISLAAGTLTIGGRTVSYGAMSVNVTGTGSTTVTYYLYGDDPTFSGSTTLVATTSPTTVTSGTGRIGFGQVTITYPAAGGTGSSGTGGGGGGGATCVWSDAWVETMRGLVPARDVVPGDVLRVLAEDGAGTTWEVCQANRAAFDLCYRVRGNDCRFAVTVSRTTPITLRDGSVIPVTDVDGHELPFCAGDDFWWEPCTIEAVGPRSIQKISVHNKTFAAGDAPGLSILTHNIKP